MSSDVGVPHDPTLTNPMNGRMWDYAGAALVAVWNGIAIVGLIILIARERDAIDNRLVCLRVASQSIALSWLSLQIWFICTRFQAVDKFPGVWPRIIALLGANAGIAVSLLPLNSSPQLQTASAIIAMAGLAGGICSLCYLGRCFSILPQARRLVVIGPYRLVRHPIYLFELVTVSGISLLYSQPGGLVLALGSFALQIPRIHYEEAVLRKNFPDYSRISARWRVIPLIF